MPVDRKKLKRTIPNLLTDGPIEHSENEYRKKRRDFNQMPLPRKNSLMLQIEQILDQIDREIMKDAERCRNRKKWHID